MLGRLRMSVTECIEAYVSLSERVFQKQRSKWKINFHIQGRFNSKELAEVVKEVLVEQGFKRDELLKDSPQAGCKVYVYMHYSCDEILTTIASCVRQVNITPTLFALQATVRRAAAMMTCSTQ
jgi:hypothetical protein